jgi:hypothetical protein
VRIYSFGVNRSRLESQIRSLGLPATVVGDQNQADVVLTVRNYYRRKPQALRDAEASGVPVHVLRSSSAGNIEQELLHISHLDAFTRQKKPSHECSRPLHQLSCRRRARTSVACSTSWLNNTACPRAAQAKSRIGAYGSPKQTEARCQTSEVRHQTPWSSALDVRSLEAEQHLISDI